MSQSSISTEAGDEWRDFILNKIVKYLEEDRESILAEFELTNQFKVSREDIEQNGLLDFDISITLHRDRKPSFGLGFGFFKANIIR